MKRLRNILFIVAALGVCFAECYAALSNEPVIITNCRSFGARSDSESKTGLASRFVETIESDCDDINKVASNKILSVSGTMAGQNGVFAFKAFYPDGQAYEHFILFKTFKDPSRDTELWLASSPDFARSTYAVAKSETDKTRPYGVFGDSAVAPSVVPALLYSFGRDLVVKDDLISARRNYDLGLIRIYESIVGGSEGFTSEFVQSEDWFDPTKRAAALKTLRDYTLANMSNIKVDNSLDPGGKSFADYMKIYSDEFVEYAKKEADLLDKKLEIEKTFALDDATYQLAKKAVEEAQKKAAIKRRANACPLADSECPADCEPACPAAAQNSCNQLENEASCPQVKCENYECKRAYKQRLKRLPGGRGYYIENENK